jgi:hypothetical protein
VKRQDTKKPGVSALPPHLATLGPMSDCLYEMHFEMPVLVSLKREGGISR